MPRKSDKMTLQFQSGIPRSLAQIPELSGKTPTIREDLKQAFCIHVYKLPLKSDVKTELGFLCDSQFAPTPLFTDMDKYSKVVGEKPLGIELDHKIDGDYAESTVGAIYELPIPPRFVKEGHIQDYMVAPADFGYFVQESRVVQDLSAELGGDLQFGKYKLAYKSTTNTKDGKSFSNERETQMDSYQVLGGESNIGIGIEHLAGTNKDYTYFNTITLTIGTKSGGSAVVSIIRVRVRHNGYIDEARRLPIDSATAQATHVHDGILDEMSSRIIK